MRKIKRHHIITKTIWQIFIYLLEVMFFASLFIYLSSFLYPFDGNRLILDVLERFILFYAFYQIVVFVILNNLNDIKSDQYLTLKSMTATALIACENKDIKQKENLAASIQEQLNTNTFNDITVRYMYEKLLILLEKNEHIQIQYMNIMAEHRHCYSSLNWRYSFLLRLLK